MHSFFFFFNDTATTEIYTLSLHDALPIYPAIRLSAQDSQYGIRGLGTPGRWESVRARSTGGAFGPFDPLSPLMERSEEHTSELQSQSNLVCRLLLEKKKKLRS